METQFCHISFQPLRFGILVPRLHLKALTQSKPVRLLGTARARLLCCFIVVIGQKNEKILCAVHAGDLFTC